jgi:CubicO group peptidase (beta-lactamase class C family)
MLRASSIVVVALLALSSIRTTSAQALPFALLERYLEPLRQQAGIPGMAAAILQDGRVVWERGFGLRDVEGVVSVLPDTPFYVADLSQTVASILTLHCYERGELELTQPIGQWVPTAANPQQTIQEILSHTGSGGFSYDPARFAVLTAPLERCFDRPYRKVVADEILDAAVMLDAVPGRDLFQAPPDILQWFDAPALDGYAQVLSRLAVPYRSEGRGRFSRGDVPAGFDTSRGLIASVRDLAAFDGALFNNQFLRPETLERSWVNASSGGAVGPMGLGWFVQNYEGERLVWHFGAAADAYSSLLLKIPGRRMTLILLANSPGLSGQFGLSDGDVTSSLFARTFLRLFL